jgi:hypothetical protein
MGIYKETEEKATILRGNIKLLLSFPPTSLVALLLGRLYVVPCGGLASLQRLPGCSQHLPQETDRQCAGTCDKDK